MPQDMDGYLLSGETVKALAEMKRWWERNARNYHPPRYRRATTRTGTSTWLGILQGSLAYGSSATVMLYKWDGSSSFVSDTTDTCYPWMMNTGDSIATNTEVVGGVIGGKRVVFNAACKNIYGS